MLLENHSVDIVKYKKLYSDGVIGRRLEKG